jgi:hypothetical protein
MGARRHQLGEEQRCHVLDRIDPERGARHPAPGKLARRGEHLVRHRVVQHGEAEAEPHAVERPLGKERTPERLQVSTAGQMVAGHEIDGATAQQPHTAGLSTAAQQLEKPEVILGAGDQPTATGEEPRRRHRQLPDAVEAHGRSVKEVLTIAGELYEHGIGLRILTGTLAGRYTPTGEGKFFFTVMAAFAELERDMIHQRTMAGLAAARAQGRVGGRPSVMDADRLAAATARLARGESPAQISKALGVSRATLYRHTDVVTARGQS